MSNKKQKYIAAEADANKGKRPPVTYSEAKRYMLISWLCTAAVGIMVFGRYRATGTPPTVLHYILLGVMAVVALAMTEGFFKSSRSRSAQGDCAQEGKRSKG